MNRVAAVGIGGCTNQYAELLTGEVVANAVVHGPATGEVRIELSMDAAVVRVSVSDDGHGHPRPRHPEPTALSGRGLAIVEALSSAWGTHTSPTGGTTVWFELEVDAD
ncbi:hypothetical protein Cma02nite_03730 [Cellulomonas marina]|uniref:Histidine kinase-like ATPase domain-containing protein n=2 Tax=Cellulomonas marina TaxID=988821 RepID=A0A1I0WND0_9CELL|nr:hypothetical protein Cma02nite_03730 [Cellulomonas marina]SFA90285.1 Histidine kinase-like ATPase domain-containing protein [Cellulomonas marina]